MEAVHLLHYYGPEECDRPDRSVNQVEIATILYRWEALTGRPLEFQSLLAYAELWRTNEYRPGLIEVSMTHLGAAMGRTEASARRWIKGIERAGLGRRRHSQRGPRGGVVLVLYDAVEQCVRWNVIQPDGQLLMDFYHDTFDGTDDLPPDLVYFDGTDDDGTVEPRRRRRVGASDQESEVAQGLATESEPEKTERHENRVNINNVSPNVDNISGKSFDGTDEIPVLPSPLKLQRDLDRATAILNDMAETFRKLDNRQGLYKWTAVGIQLLQAVPAFTVLNRSARLTQDDLDEGVQRTNDKQAGTSYYCGFVRRRLKDRLGIPADAPIKLPNYGGVKESARKIGIPWNHKDMARAFQ